MTVRIAHLYPEQMNIYGDRGNIITLCKRLEWRGFKVIVDEVNPGDVYNFQKADIVFGGGGQDKGQLLIADDLLRRGKNLIKAADEGVVMLVICGLYQLFGRGFIQADKTELNGIGIFKAHTNASSQRLIGNVVVKTHWGDLVGFENHSGQTFLEPEQLSLGRVLKGYGNNYDSKEEGAIYKNVFGSYLHGPLLPKNPKLADALILRALARRGIKTLQPLNNELEHAAAQVAASRPQ